MNERKMTIDKVKQLVENVLSENSGVTVESIEPNRDGDYCTVILYGDVDLHVLNDIAESVGDEPIISGEDYCQINLSFRIPDADKDGVGGSGKHEENAVRTIDRLISWMLYSMTFCFLLGVAGLDLSAREIIAYSLMLGLVVGSINNIERVMRELFKKEE